MAGRNVVVLGAGMVGSTVARDLAKEYRVRAVDRDAPALEALRERADVSTVQADLSDPAQVAREVAAADLVIGALPGFMGFRALETVIDSGKDTVDISFFPEDPFALDARARARGSRRQLL